MSAKNTLVWILSLTLCCLLALSGCAQTTPTAEATNSATPEATVSATAEATAEATVEATVAPTAEASSEAFTPIWIDGPGTLSADLDRDGVDETLVTRTADAESDWYCDLTVIRADGTEVTVHQDGAEATRLGVVCFTDGAPLDILFCTDFASDDFYTYCYQFVDNELIERSTFAGTPIAMEDGGVLVVHKVVNVLGSWSAEMRYRLDGNGVLQQIPYALWMNLDDEKDIYPIKNIAEITVEMEDGDGYKEAVLPIGTSIRIYATDETSAAYFRMEDGQGGIIHYTTDEDGLLLIGGVRDWDLFEMLPYAG